MALQQLLASQGVSLRMTMGYPERGRQQQQQQQQELQQQQQQQEFLCSDK